MSEIGNGSVTKFLANGGGAITFRLLATAMGALIIWLVRMEGEQLNERLNRIESAISSVSQVAQDASARGDVNAVRLDDHEHRISELEGAHRR